MNNDYLWDRSGEVDPELKQLEETLGALRYQPRPLEIPASVRPGRRGKFFPALAIAATIALVALGLGVLLSLNHGQATPPKEAHQSAPAERQKDGSPKLSASPEEPKQIVARNSAPQIKPRHREIDRNLAARNPVADRNATQPKLNAGEQAEKQQLMLALRLVSVKLSFAQRRAQGTPPLNAIRNQHPMG